MFLFRFVRASAVQTACKRGSGCRGALPRHRPAGSCAEHHEDGQGSKRTQDRRQDVASPAGASCLENKRKAHWNDPRTAWGLIILANVVRELSLRASRTTEPGFRENETVLQFSRGIAIARDFPETKPGVVSQGLDVIASGVQGSRETAGSAGLSMRQRSMIGPKDALPRSRSSGRAPITGPSPDPARTPPGKNEGPGNSSPSNEQNAATVRCRGGVDVDPPCIAAT